MTSLIDQAALRGAGKASTALPVRTVKTKKAPALNPYQQLVAQNKQPWPTLPGGVTPTGLMSGLLKTNWSTAAQNALMPAYTAGINALNFGMQRGLADARAQAGAMQGAYLAAGGQMPRVGSEYSVLGDVLKGIGGAAAGGLAVPGAGAPGATPALPDAGGAQYIFGSAPANALAQSGYYKDIGTAGEAAAEQMQGREQAMVLQRQLASKAMEDYLSGAQDLSTSFLSKVPETAIALSGEARAQAAGALSGLQFQTEQRANVQKLLLQYAQMRADAKTSAQKLALDKWAQQSLDKYRGTMSGIAQQKANAAAGPKPLSNADKARLTTMAHTFYNGVQPDYRLITDTDPVTHAVTGRHWEEVPGTRVNAVQWGDALNQLMAAGASRAYAIQLLEAQGWKRGEGGRPPTVQQQSGANILAGTAAGANPFGLVGPPGLFGANWPNYAG